MSQSCQTEAEHRAIIVKTFCVIVVGILLALGVAGAIVFL